MAQGQVVIRACQTRVERYGPCEHLDRRLELTLSATELAQLREDIRVVWSELDSAVQQDGLLIEPALSPDGVGQLPEQPRVVGGEFQSTTVIHLSFGWPVPTTLQIPCLTKKGYIVWSRCETALAGGQCSVQITCSVVSPGEHAVAMRSGSVSGNGRLRQNASARQLPTFNLSPGKRR
jgi:hypothetical protein